ncbi:MAG: arginase family protein, partial [Nitrososphaera sp.]|uniref:arginase family protein n=1 Tax=Nitrososphaera sp. TaxID=1971748 RepID=UPI003D6F256E
MKFYRANAASAEQADIVIIGVPDESRSHATRKGTSAAPDILRAASNDSEFFVRDGKAIPTVPMRGTFDGKRIFDAGNVARDDLHDKVLAQVAGGRFPVTIGGDHSLTRDVLAAIHESIGEKLSLLYFDAHPDFVSSARNYYGSVLTDSAQYVDFARSMAIGTRAAEREEVENAKSAGLQLVTPIDIVELGVRKVAEIVTAKTAGRRVYVSIDLDCVDPASAPGVSVPSPGGLATADLLYMLTKVMSTCNVAGFDIVELSPD